MSTPITYRDLLIDRYRLIYDWVPEDTKNLLDIGCGNGIFTRWLRDRAVFVAGADHNAEQLVSARRYCPEMIAVAAEGERLPFADHSFDVVVMSDMLEHVNNDESTIREAMRVLRPQGLILISLPNRGPLTVLDGDNIVNRLVHLISRLKIPKRTQSGTGSRYLFEGFTYKRHRHYGLKDIKRLMGPSSRIEKKYYGGTMLWPILYLVEKIGEVFFKRPLVTTDYRILRRLRSLDFRLCMGSWSYNLVVAVRKQM